MVFLDVVVVALLTGKLVGGSLETLADTPIKGMRLAFAAIPAHNSPSSLDHLVY